MCRRLYAPPPARYTGCTRIQFTFVAAVALAAAAASADLIVMKDGSKVSGSLKSCDEEHCSAGGKRIPVALIARIDLVEKPLPAPAAAAGSVILTDGTTRRGAFGGLNLGYVWIGDEEIDRGLVATIVLQDAAPAPTPAEVPPSSPTPPAPPQAQAVPKSSPGGSPSNQASGRGSVRTPPGPKPGKPGALWKGILTGRLYGSADGATIDLMGVVITRLREYNIPMMAMTGARVKTIGRVAFLWSEDSVVRNTYMMQAPGVYCSGEGHMVATTSAESPQPSTMWDNRSGDETKSMYGVDVPKGKARYVVSIPAMTEHEPARAQTYQVACRSEASAGSFEQDYFPFIAGRTATPVLLGSEDPEPRYVDAGKMVGGYTVPNMFWPLPGASSDFPLTLTVAWAICREDVACPPPPSPGAGTGSSATCSEGREKDFAQLCEDQLRSYWDELLPLQEQHAKMQQEADRYWPDFVSAARQCIAWKLVQTALESVLGGYSGALGSAGRNADVALDLFKAAISGDAGVITGAMVGDAEANFYPWKKTKEAWKNFKKAQKYADLLSQDPNTLAGSGLDACAGAVNPQTHLNAEKFLALSRELGEFYRTNIAPKVNRIDSKILNCLQKDYEAWRACRQAAECRAESPDVCGSNPYDSYSP